MNNRRLIPVTDVHAGDTLVGDLAVVEVLDAKRHSHFAATIDLRVKDELGREATLNYLDDTLVRVERNDPDEPDWFDGDNDHYYEP